MSYGITFTAGSLIPSFCLSIKGRHDAPSLSLCSDGLKSDFGSLCFVSFSVPFSTLRWTSLWISQLSFFTLPATAYECQKASSVDHRLLHLTGLHKRLVSAYSWLQSRIVSSSTDYSLWLYNTRVMTGTPGSLLSGELLHWTVLLVAYSDLFY